MKLTKQQRHMAYMIMLAEVEENILNYMGVGLCSLCKRSIDIFIYYGRVKSIFPELYSKRTTNDANSYWFALNGDGWLKRINILKQCIGETYTKW